VGDYAGVPASVARVGVVPTRARPRKCVAVRGFFQINISTLERTGAKNELAESRDIVFQSRPRIAFGISHEPHSPRRFFPQTAN
jgi:hypothetical protein